MHHDLAPTLHRGFLCFIPVSVSLILCVSVPVARAQTSELVGVRALGMAGAFTAVADDSTATWWNHAGLATGAYVNAVLEFAHPDDDRPGEGFRGVSFACRASFRPSAGSSRARRA